MALPPPPAIQNYQQTIKASINDNERNARLALPQSEPLNIPKGQEAPMAQHKKCLLGALLLPPGLFCKAAMEAYSDCALVEEEKEGARA